MAQQTLERETLGQKHRNFNKLVNETIIDNTTIGVDEIDYEQDDLDNLFKIDVACARRNVDYILKVFQCEDMLYVSRAIKKSVWLITDEQYAYIINPEYLHNDLSQNMTFKAFSKLILSIKLNLRDEKRAEDFFDYYKKQDLLKALKWLPNCSVSFIENVIEEHANDIPKKLLKRLCEKSITFLEIFCRNYNRYYKRETLLSTLFLLNKDTEKYLDVIEATHISDIPNFGPKYTKKIMETSRDRVLENLDKYVDFLHVPTFAKYIKKEEVKEFILSHIKNKKMRFWFAYNKIKYFINKLPIEDRFNFIKSMFIEKEYEDYSTEDEIFYDDIRICYQSAKRNTSSSQNIYCWYIYAPFNKALVELKQLIRNESNPTERNSILAVLLTCAGTNQNNIRTLLKYYRENHINEAFKFKNQFVNLVVTKTETYKYDKDTWGYLNDLFNSLDIYNESDKNVQSCVKSIILYNVINGEIIPEIIQKKFVFETLKNIRKKLNAEENEKVFNYLFNLVASKIKNENFKDKKEFHDNVDAVQNLLELLNDWNKDLNDYPVILEYIKDVTKRKKDCAWPRDISGLYNVKKSWRKLLFSESLVLNPTEESCINALKHGPEILNKHETVVEGLSLNNNIFLKRFLRKLRIYWHKSLANNFTLTYYEKLDQKNYHRAIIPGICTLLSQKEFFDFVYKYVPVDSKIDWSKSDDLEHSLRKNIATYMHIARPQPSLTTALLYAKGDYLQFLLPSLNAILYNMSPTYTREHIKELLNTRVSLQKHGIRIALSKLKHEELKQLFTDIWRSSKNSSIRADIFNQTFIMLCKAKDPLVIKDIWQLLSMFIDHLHTEENKNIYCNLSKVEKVPMSVRPDFWIKSYQFLKSLPEKGNYSSLIANLTANMSDIMEFLDDDVIANIFLESFDKKFCTQNYSYSRLVAEYLLSSRTEAAQHERYNKIFIPIFERALEMWDKKQEGEYYHVRKNLRDILLCMFSEFQNIVLDKGMIFPNALFSDIINKLESSLSVTENYILLTNTKLELGCLKIFHEILNVRKEIILEAVRADTNKADQFSKWKPLYEKAAPLFGEFCLNYLKEDVIKNFHSIYLIFAEALDEILTYFGRHSMMITLSILNAFLESESGLIEGYLLVLKLLPEYLYEKDEKALKLEIINKISRHPSNEVRMHYWHFQNK